MEILKLIMKIIKKLLRYTNVIPNPPIEDIVMVDEEKPEESNIEEKPEESNIEEKKVLITEEQFKKLFPIADISFVDILNKTLRKNKIDTLERVSSFLAQTGHESAMYTVFTENLNYSREALLRVFPRHFTVDIVDHYARNPERIANRAYANRMGNGDEHSGDGWKFRGRSAIQLTGRANYEEFAKSIGKSIDEVIPYLETYKGIIDATIWFWNKHNLNRFADQDDLRGQTRVINGGFNGLPHREELYTKAKKILKDNFN